MQVSIREMHYFKNKIKKRDLQALISIHTGKDVDKPDQTS